MATIKSELTIEKLQDELESVLALVESTQLENEDLLTEFESLQSEYQILDLCGSDLENL